MATRMLRYVFSCSDEIPEKAFEMNPNLGPFGDYKKRKLTDNIPLIGQIEKQNCNSIAIIQNKLFISPVFFHKESLESQKNDSPYSNYFLCSLNFSKSSGDKSLPDQVIIRELPTIYSVG